MGPGPLRPSREPQVLGLREAAELLQLKPRTLSHLAQHGRVPARKVGGVWRFYRDELDHWIGRNAEGVLPAEGRPRLLVVEDDECYGRLLATRLGDAYEVHLAHTGAAGLLKIGLLRPDLVILDIGLPFVTGLEICAVVREEPAVAGLPILVLTGHDAIEEMVKALDLGADDYLIKPFNNAELQARIRRLLQRAGRFTPARSLGA